jgi:hypothetical protein
METVLEPVIVDFYVANKVVARTTGFIVEADFDGIFICSCYNKKDVTDHSGERYISAKDIIEIIYPNLS